MIGIDRRSAYEGQVVFTCSRRLCGQVDAIIVGVQGATGGVRTRAIDQYNSCIRSLFTRRSQHALETCHYPRGRHGRNEESINGYQ